MFKNKMMRYYVENISFDVTTFVSLIFFFFFAQARARDPTERQ